MVEEHVICNIIAHVWVTTNRRARFRKPVAIALINVLLEILLLVCLICHYSITMAADPTISEALYEQELFFLGTV